MPFDKTDLIKRREGIVWRASRDRNNPEYKANGDLVIPMEPESYIPPGADYFDKMDRNGIATNILERVGTNLTQRLGFPRQRPLTSCYRNTQYLMLVGGRHTIIMSKQKSLLTYAQTAGWDLVFDAEAKYYTTMAERLEYFKQKVTNMWNTPYMRKCPQDEAPSPRAA